MQKGHVPERWKEAHVIALHKKGSKSNSENCRPISLTSAYEKNMESIIRDSMVAYMLPNGLFADHQNGFVPNSWSMTQLLCITVSTKCLDSSKCIDTIFLDFQKAFDSVPHERLLSILVAYGIIG